MSLSISGKTAIVTGAGHGIGRAIARHFLARGANVVLADSDESALEDVRRAIGSSAQSDEAENIRTYHGDMSQKLCMANLLSTTIDAYDRIDILVNAHRLVKHCDPLSPDPDALEEMLRQNMVAGLRLSQMVARRMISQGEDDKGEGQLGAIVNLTTLAAQRPHPQLLAYSIACAAQDQATRALALTLAPYRIRVNSVAFGSVMTDEMRAQLREEPELREGILKGTPMGRIAATDELADAVLYLVSDSASFVTGQILNVDGGRSLLDPVQAAMF